jgi:hypothetical protein
MKLVIGILIGLFYLVISGLAFRSSAGGWSAGQSDVGLWWAVIASLLAIAGLGAIVGSVIHGRRGSRN